MVVATLRHMPQSVIDARRVMRHLPTVDAARPAGATRLAKYRQRGPGGSAHSRTPGAPPLPERRAGASW